MALVGLGRVSTKGQDTARQYRSLGPICIKAFEEKVCRSLKVKNQPRPSAAIASIREGDMLAAQEVYRLGRNLIEGLVVVPSSCGRGIAVNLLDGIAKGEHTEHSIVLDMAITLGEDCRRDIAREAKNTLEPGHGRAGIGGRPKVIDDDKRAVIMSRREKGEPIRESATAVGVSIGAVHSTLASDEMGAS